MIGHLAQERASLIRQVHLDGPANFWMHLKSFSDACCSAIFHQVIVMSDSCREGVTVTTWNRSPGEHPKVHEPLLACIRIGCRYIENDEAGTGIGQGLSLCILIKQEVMKDEQQVGLVLFRYAQG